MREKNSRLGILLRDIQEREDAERHERRDRLLSISLAVLGVALFGVFIYLSVY